MSQPSDRPAPRFGPRVRTYEQRITAEFEQEIADLNGKLYERSIAVSRGVASLMALDAAVKRERAARDVFVDAVAAASRGNPVIAVALRDLAVALKKSSDLFSADWERITADYPELGAE